MTTRRRNLGRPIGLVIFLLGLMGLAPIAVAHEHGVQSAPLVKLVTPETASR